ncbi:protein TPX2-like isoform X2 [Nicotiana tomentosiformis]|uniref:protein TPX2-like isoform X2 n=1 Tax=Nicotiana tomentosiformis TaxID=4098 RepID=UPI00051B7165|nr:protein TPX2-like isoform X2 [Nicotiana tomentosiformis]
MADTKDDPNFFIIDEIYEFSAPRFYDFINGETEEDMRKAELWFETCMPRIKASRSVQLEIPCDFTEGEELQSNSRPAAEVTSSKILEEETPKENRPAAEVLSSEVKEEVNGSLPNVESVEKQPTSQEICTPGKQPRKTDSNKQKTAKKIASMLRNPSALKSKTTPQLSHVKSTIPASMRKQAILRTAVGTPNFGQENQAVKRQKLDSGKARQILNVKPQNLPHKTRHGASCATFSSVAISRKEDRKMYAREPVPPFISTAEMMKKFHSSTREMSLPCISSSTPHRKPKLTLTAPKEPEFETAQRVRPTTVKSSAELEEEMMAKIPKFKARPLNKKLFEAPTLPPLPKSTPQLPEFKEFHLETMARANQNVETSSILSMESTQSHKWKPHLTAPKSPVLQTSLRARPLQIKSSEELEKEELEKIPKFKARPLNKKIFESKGDLGMFCNTKKQVTVPQEFHFATDERIPPPPANVADLFDKLSLNSEPNEQTIPRNTKPNPFHLYTEERGAEKERKLFTELLQKQIEEERSRVPKAIPYPYTTDYPVIPPKPEPKHCTKPEPFQLESLLRHEREMQRELEERQRLEKEEAKMRTFRAQPVLIEDPIPVPEKERKPLTQVEGFNLHVDHRAVGRAEFDKKIKEKELMYQKYREEAEAARLMEEEKALKQLRKTLVPHARPVPKFDHPFLPQKSSRAVTKPRSPKLLIIKRQERRKMACPYAAAVSSAASKMR